MIYNQGDTVYVKSLKGTNTHCAGNIQVGDTVEVSYMNYGQTWVAVSLVTGTYAYIDINDVELHTSALPEEQSILRPNLDSIIYPTYIPEVY